LAAALFGDAIAILNHYQEYDPIICNTWLWQ
jgi:hypothetical protein